jgi:hypothetical protein
VFESRTYCTGTAVQYIVKQNSSDELEQVKLNGSYLRAHPGRGAARLHPPPPSQNLKNTDFVDMMLSNVLYDLPLNQNQPLKSADD